MHSIYLRKGKEKAIRQLHPWIFSGAIEKIIGNIKSAKQKSNTTFGIIKESLFNPGVIINVTAMVPKTKIFGILLLLIFCTRPFPYTLVDLISL